MISVSGAVTQPSSAPIGAAGRLKALQAAALIGALAFVPSLMTYLFATASHAPGTALAGVIVVVALLPQLRLDKVITLFLVLALAIVSHLLAAALLEPVQFSRALLSLILVGITLAACSCIGGAVFQLPDRIAERMLIVLRVLMVLIGVAAVAGVQPNGLTIQIFGFVIGGNDWPKSVFPFTESSHYALAFAPLLIDACVRSPGLRRYAWLLVGLALGYFLQNLTLIVVVGVAAAVSLPLPGLIAGGVALVATVASIDVAYFSDRLDFSETSTNLSTLIYIQGWELVVDSFHRTSGWGLGFQQLGLGPVNSAAADAIFRQNQFELNLQDGGFTAAKLIGEFGVIGICLCIAYIFVGMNLGLRLRKAAKDPGMYPIATTFAYSIICAYSIDLFVRGVGYFNGSTLLFVCALYYYFGIERSAARRRAVH